MLNPEQEVIREFHKLYYESAAEGGTWQNTRWMGWPLLKCPLDLWVYQEILFEIKPELIIECGTFSGGSALFLAHICDLIGCGEIVTIDIEKRSQLPQHPRISYWTGSSISDNIIENARQKSAGKSPILVLLDSDHSAEHVLQELRLYNSLVTPGSYLIVEDSNINGHPVLPDFGKGPMEAIRSFLQENNSFYIDKNQEKFGLTFNPNGYLKRKNPDSNETELSSNIERFFADTETEKINQLKQKYKSDILRVDLGGAINKPANFVGVDIHPGPGVDIVADLTKPFPFPDNSVDEIRAHDIIEHLPDRLHTMNEIWRVCKAGAKVDIRVPSTDGRGAFQDPTHVSFWNINSFLYYCVDFPPYLNLCKRYGFKGAFKVVKLEQEESFDLIIHVIAKLLVIKENETLENAETNFQKIAEREDFLSELSQQIQDFQDADTEKYLSSLESLRNSRKKLAYQWLNYSPEQLQTSYVSGWGKANQLLLNSGIKTEPLTPEEQNFVQQLEVDINKGFENPQIINYLLAAMLYRRANQLPLPIDITGIPQWFLQDYVQFILQSPRYFQQSGEAESYYLYLKQWVDYLHSQIFSNPDSLFWQKIALDFVEKANFIPVYFNESNLKEIYQKRSQIIELVLKQRGYRIDFEFPPSPPRNKIRVGILAAHFLPTAETFASLPVYEYLTRDFEVILYSIIQTGQPLEEYCQSCAHSFKLLPNNLIDAVNLIRKDDLDILWIATNVTAVFSQICLLSHHRLARLQMTSVASVVTTGIKNIDYYISGELTDPLETAQQHYQETLVKLQGSAHCFSYAGQLKKINIKIDRQSLGISQASIVFISGANFFKLTPELLDTWAKIIAAVPNSILVLFPFGPNWTDNYPKSSFSNYLKAKFAQYEVADRLLVLDPQPTPNREEIKEYYKIADIYLDSYPFSGTSSFIEPLEIGLPIISQQGTYFRSAMGAGILKALEMPDLVADSEASYIQLAINLANNPDLRNQKRQEIQQKMANNPPFVDSRGFSSKISVLFHNLFRNYLAETLKEDLRLNDINLIIFPDWNQPEELLGEDLSNTIKAIVNNPDKSKITLLVDTGNISPEDADTMVSSVVMNLLMEEDLDVENGPEISLIGNLSKIQWECLLEHIHSRLVLSAENQNSLLLTKADKLPIYDLNLNS